jgi:protoporphyrinogen oxidase
MSNKEKAVVIGAGPAGLTAGAELLKTGKYEVSIIERDNCVGGLSRTTDYKGYKFDFGPHHFITNDPDIEKWWLDVMGDEFLKHKRFTRIYYKKRFFHYPLEAWNVIRGLKLAECFKCVFSYIKQRLFPIKNVRSFEDWVVNRFGRRLFSMFFESYTEKLWGIPCNKISSDWAAQRIKGFSLSSAIFYAFFGRWFKKNAPRTLRDDFYYPPQGAGQLWDRVADSVVKYEGGNIHCNENVVNIIHINNRIKSVITRNDESVVKEYNGDHVLSTMSLKALIEALSPSAPPLVYKASQSLIYRALILVNLIVDRKNVIPDHWLYIHDKDVEMIRIDNMNNFSKEMVVDQNHTSLGLEYFLSTEDDLWKASDEELIKQGALELEKLGIARADEVIDGMVLRSSEAYPVYDEHYQTNLGMVRSYLASFSNLHLMGRNGLHRYNNMDLAMLSAIEAVEEVKKNSVHSFATKGVKQPYVS